MHDRMNLYIFIYLSTIMYASIHYNIIKLRLQSINQHNRGQSSFFEPRDTRRADCWLSVRHMHRATYGTFDRQNLSTFVRPTYFLHTS